MSLITGVLGALGVGDNPNYSFSQQQRDFLKLQTLYAFRLKQRLEAGTITQTQYDANTVWAANDQLTPPFNGWYAEFKAAINSEDLNWLASQIGTTVEELTAYLGDAIKTVTQDVGSAIGTAAGSAASGISGGLIKGFFGSLNGFGWLALGVVGIGVYYGFKKGIIQKAFKVGAKGALL